MKELLGEGEASHSRRAYLTSSSLGKEQTLPYCFPAPGDVLLLSPFWPGLKQFREQSPVRNAPGNVSADFTA